MEPKTQKPWYSPSFLKCIALAGVVCVFILVEYRYVPHAKGHLQKHASLAAPLTEAKQTAKVEIPQKQQANQLKRRKLEVLRKRVLQLKFKRQKLKRNHRQSKFKTPTKQAFRLKIARKKTKRTNEIALEKGSQLSNAKWESWLHFVSVGEQAVNLVPSPLLQQVDSEFEGISESPLWLSANMLGGKPKEEWIPKLVIPIPGFVARMQENGFQDLKLDLAKFQSEASKLSVSEPPQRSAISVLQPPPHFTKDDC